MKRFLLGLVVLGIIGFALILVSGCRNAEETLKEEDQSSLESEEAAQKIRDHAKSKLLSHLSHKGWHVFIDFENIGDTLRLFFVREGYDGIWPPNYSSKSHSRMMRDSEELDLIERLFETAELVFELWPPGTLDQYELVSLWPCTRRDRYGNIISVDSLISGKIRMSRATASKINWDFYRDPDLEKLHRQCPRLLDHKWFYGYTF